MIQWNNEKLQAFRKMRSNVPAWLKTLIWTFLFFPAAFPLFAQNAVTVTNSAPDESNGSLGWAITTLNASGTAGAITFTVDTSPILTVTLPPISQSVTFEGGGLYLTGQNEAQAQLLFQQAFTQSNNLQLTNNGALGAGLDASVTAASWTIGSSANTTLNAASGASTQIGNQSFVGQNGGNASVTVGTLTTLTQSVQVFAGSGGSVTASGGTGDLGGMGGSAFVTAGSFTLSGTNFQLLGGQGERY